MTEMPNKLTLIAMAGAMETLHAMRVESPKDRYTPDDAAALCSLAPMTVLFFGGEAPPAMQYVHPSFTTHLSDADIARIADAVRPAPGFTGGEVYTSGHADEIKAALFSAGKARAIDAVRHASSFNVGKGHGKLPTAGPFPIGYCEDASAGQMASTEGISQREPWLKAAVSRQLVAVDADGQPIPADKGGLE